MENINKPSEAIKFDLDFDDDTDIMEVITYFYYNIFKLNN